MQFAPHIVHLQGSPSSLASPALFSHLSHVTSILGPLVARSFASQLHLLPPPPRLTSSAACHAVVSSDLFHDSSSIRIFFGDCRVFSFLFFSLVPVFIPAPNEYHATMTDNALHCSSVKRGDEPNLSHLHIRGPQNQELLIQRRYFVHPSMDALYYSFCRLMQLTGFHSRAFWDRRIFQTDHRMSKPPPHHAKDMFRNKPSA
jgi:hypothetical protein